MSEITICDGCGKRQNKDDHDRIGIRIKDIIVYRGDLDGWHGDGKKNSYRDYCSVKCMVKDVERMLVKSDKEAT